MIPQRHILNLIITFFLLLLIITYCSAPEAKPVFKYSKTKGDNEIITNVTNAKGVNVLSYSMKTKLISTYKYNAFNTSQIEGIYGEAYVPIESGRKIPVDTYFELDVYEKPEYQKISTKEGKTLGYYGAVEYNRAIYATERFVSSLPIKVYSFDGENIELEKNPVSAEYYKGENGTIFPHSGRLNLVYTKGLDTLIVLPSKIIKDSLGTREVGFTAIKLDGVNDILPFIKDIDKKEQTIYDKIPSFAENDFKILAVEE